MLQFYPFPEHRPGTRDALKKVRKAMEEGKRFIIIKAPTGSGKSGLAVAIARSEKAVILTPTKILQDQYESTDVFTTEYTIKGKSNYKCGLKNYKNVTVDKAICCSNATTADNAYLTPWEDAIKGAKKPAAALKARCVSAGVCEYYKLLNGIPSCPGAIMNYDLAFLVKKRPGQNEGIDLGQTIVLDEAHQLIDKIKSVFGFSLPEKKATKILGATAKRGKTEGAIEWVNRLYGLAQTRAAEETELRKAAEISTFLAELEGILALPIDDEYKFHIEDQKDKVEIKPLNMRYLKGMVFYPFKHVVMMSATIPPNFCDLLGLKPEETEVIEIPSTFPRENRPVVFVKNMEPLNYKTKLNSRHPTFKAVQKIMRDHSGEKGIIHCSNYRIFEELRTAYPRNSRFIWVGRGMDKTKALERHANTDKDTVLVSPSMLEGVDLKDDLARFQIMLKLPFARLDDYTKKMMKIYEGYYEADVIMNITQAYGRAIRTAEDHATFYILDGAFARLLKNKEAIPKYLFEAMQSKNIDV